jgi:hypothetical protein
MKTLIAVLALAIMLSPSIIQAEEHQDPGVATNQPPSQWGYSLSELIQSEYYGTIFGGIFYAGPMSWTDLVASHHDKYGSLTFDLSIGQKLDRLDRYNGDGGNEYDFTIDHTLNIDIGSYQVKADAGVCYLALYDLRDASNDAFEEFCRLDFPIGTNHCGGAFIQPYAEVFHYHEVGYGFHNKGWWTYGGAFRNQPLGITVFGNELNLNIDFRIGASAGAYSSKTGIEYYRLAFALPIVKGNWMVSPSIIFQIPGGSGRTFVHNDESNVFYTLFIKRSF